MASSKRPWDRFDPYRSDIWSPMMESSFTTYIDTVKPKEPPKLDRKGDKVNYLKFLKSRRRLKLESVIKEDVMPKKKGKDAGPPSPLQDWRGKVEGNSPASIHGGFKAGDFVVGLPICKDTYRLTEAGRLGYVTDIFHTVQVSGIASGPMAEEMRERAGFHETMKVMAFSDANTEGRSYGVCHLYFRLASKQEVLDRIAEVERARNYLKVNAFRTGDPVELTRNFKVAMHGMFGSGYHVLKKGSPAIVDVSPGEGEEDGERTRSAHTSNRAVTEFDMSKLVEVQDMAVGPSHKLRQFIAPSVSLYFPEMELEELVPIEAIRARRPEMQNAQIVLPDGYMEKLHTICRRVTDDQTHEAIYERLGLHKVCQKGRGAIAMMYGPPGTGKTMTAEMLAEQIGRPLIKLNLGSILDSAAMNKKLKEGFARARRYRAVLLLDEVDIFIRKRGSGHPVFDENTSMFLRVLEWYDGILLMTTNLAGSIDPAIFSRVHVCLEYGNVTAADRRDIWRSMLPRELMQAMVGEASHHENILEELQKVDINGREVKMIIQNVVTRAVSELRRGGEDLAEADWSAKKFIRMETLLEEAQLLHGQREDLKR